MKERVSRLFPRSSYLNEEQVTALKLEIERHHNLSSTGQVEYVSTRLERQLYIAKALQFANEEIQQLQSELAQKNQKIVVDAPKVEFYDQVADSQDAIDIRNVAAAHNIPGLGRHSLLIQIIQC
jgi:hypothetical protein